MKQILYPFSIALGSNRVEISKLIIKLKFEMLEYFFSIFTINGSHQTSLQKRKSDILT